VALAWRAEAYSDLERVIVVTGQPYGLRASGASFNLDASPAARLLWRTEARWLRARDALFPARGAARGLAADDAVVVSSLALTL
jgi:hypothetical protein